jgi:hypothetical protein
MDGWMLQGRRIGWMLQGWEYSQPEMGNGGLGHPTSLKIIFAKNEGRGIQFRNQFFAKINVSFAH